MNALSPAQAEQLTVFQQAVRERFQEGGSILSVIAVVSVIALVLCAAYLLSRRIEQRGAPEANASPRRLFKLLLTRLRLGRQERRILLSAARSARLQHPTVLLLSRSMFDRYVTHRVRGSRVGAEPRHSESTQEQKTLAATVAALRSRLFPAIDPVQDSPSRL